jgi:hypothetical protein
MSAIEVKVTSEDDDAEAAIAKLREVAKFLKAQGDRNASLERINFGLRDQNSDLEHEVSTLQSELRPEGEWADALDLFRLDLIDRDELLERTLGVRT